MLVKRQNIYSEQLYQYILTSFSIFSIKSRTLPVLIYRAFFFLIIMLIRHPLIFTSLLMSNPARFKLRPLQLIQPSAVEEREGESQKKFSTTINYFDLPIFRPSKYTHVVLLMTQVSGGIKDWWVHLLKGLSGQTSRANFLI